MVVLLALIRDASSAVSTHTSVDGEGRNRNGKDGQYLATDPGNYEEHAKRSGNGQKTQR
jgi:hypothetical protein